MTDEGAPQPVVLTVGRGAVGAPDEGRLHVMVWSAAADPELLVAEQFRSEGQLRDWLRAISRNWTPSVRWTAELEADAALRDVLAQAVNDARRV